MLPSEGKIAALIGSRICHDLISPIGAINNGLELLSMTGDAKGPEMDLIAESVGNASARIRYFRIAFGAAGEQQIGVSEVTGIIHDTMGAGRVRVDYQPSDAHPRNMIRLVFLGIMCLEGALPYGGEITVACSDGKWTLTGRADKLNVDTELWSVLADPSKMDEVAPAQVQFALLPMLARDDKLALSTKIGEDQVEIRF